MNNDLKDSDVTSLTPQGTEVVDEKVLEEVNDTLEEAVSKTDRKNVDYSVDGEFVLFSSEALVKVLSQLSTILDLATPRKVSRGLSFIIEDDNIRIVTPNELFYFTADIKPEKCTLPKGTIFFIDFNFLVKMIRFLPLKVLVYKKADIYYLRLVTGDLELIDTALIDSDLNKLKQDWSVLDTVICTVNKTEVTSSLGTLSKLYSFAADLPRRVFDVNGELVQFNTPFVQSTAALHFPKVRLIPPVVNYLLKAVSLCSVAGEVELHETSSETITRYAIVFDGITMITNYASSKYDDTSKATKDLLPDGTAIQFDELKYVLDYVTNITYAKGRVTLVVDGNKILGKIKLNNNNESTVEIPVINNEITLPTNLKAVVSTKDLYKAFNTLDTSLTTYLGYADGFIYLWNTNVILAIMTFGGSANE